MGGVRRPAADEVVDGHAIRGHAFRHEFALAQPGEHRLVVGRLVQRRVLALHVEYDDGHPRGAGAGDQPRDRRGLPATSRAEDRGVPREDRLRLRRRADLHALVPDRQAQPHVAAAPEYLRGLRVGEYEHRAVRQWAQRGGVNSPLGNSSPRIVTEGDRGMVEVVPAMRRDSLQDVRVRTQTVGFGERPRGDHAEELPPVLAAADSHQ